MPEDLKIPFEYDETGDAATVEGQEFYYRHALQLALLATEDIKGEALTETDIVETRDRIGERLAGSPYFEAPIFINIVSSDVDEFTAEITAENTSTFEITV